MSSSYLFTSESVSEGHPDKVADQISDAILDAILAEDKDSRVAAETLCNTGLVVLAGEITTKAKIDYHSVARNVVKRIGYDNTDYGIDYKGCAVLVAYDTQSPDIAQGVDEGRGLNLEQGAGDQGLMFGFACDETAELMPMPIAFAHRLTRRLAEARRSSLKWLRPDGKSQVTIQYVDGKPAWVDAVVLSTQHSPEMSAKQIKEAVMEEVVAKALPKAMLTRDTKYFINPTGNFVVGGPMGDAGVTGRKIIVDTYGGMGRHGGGAFSGKDPSKVDRSAAYMARYVAKNVVASGLARRCEVQVAYAIGVAEPVSVMLDCFGTELVDVERLEKAVRSIFPLKPAGLTAHLKLLTPVYERTAAYGHFGRPEFSWERTDLAAALKSEVGAKNGAARVKRPAARAAASA